MRWASMRTMDISNGQGVGVALFVQGCPFHCENCFNQDIWGFDQGKPWTNTTRDTFFELINRPYIQRVSILGGEPLADQNVEEVLYLISIIRQNTPNKTIWLYTGFTWESIQNFETSLDSKDRARFATVSQCHVLVDGLFINELKDITLEFRGSSNQRLIDVQTSLKKNNVVLWKCE